MRVGIVGAGPAGSRTAQLLGELATIFDHTHPREKPCGGGLTPKAYTNLDIPNRLVDAVMTDMVIHYKQTSVRVDIPDVLSVNRKRFDSWMLKEAIKSGATHIKERVVDIVRSPKGWILITDNDEYTFDFIVGADGAHSLVRQKLLGPHKQFAVAIETTSKIPLGDEMHLWFFPGFFGYAWSFPKLKHSNVGIGQFVSGYYSDLVKRLTDLFPGLDMGDLSGWIIPMDYGKAGFEDYALIGDAAGHVNPISGEGISYAIMGAEELARAILAGHPQRYETYWRNRYGQELWWDSLFSSLVYKSIPRAVRFHRFLSKSMPSIIRGTPVTPWNILYWLVV